MLSAAVVWWTGEVCIVDRTETVVKGDKPDAFWDRIMVHFLALSS